MRFLGTEIPGVVIVEIEPHTDERGLFARTFCQDEFAAQGLVSSFPQCSVSVNTKALTLRGMHYQQGPKSEAKLVRVTRGRIFDVALDLRPHSPSYLRWTGLELSADKRNALYVPQGCAHGFLTLEDNCEVYYQISEMFAPSSARTFRWNDPAFGITWPFDPLVMNERDAGCPDFSREETT